MSRAAHASPATARELIVALRHLHHVLLARLDGAVEGQGMSYAQYEVLLLLEEEPKLHAGEIGRRLGVTRQAAHGLLRQLERGALRDLRDGLEACRRRLGPRLSPWWLE
jgi:DNA-binding MarR family transcriptional regulator